MTDENDNTFNLSRRKALAGIGTIGAAAGLGGLGTMAQFTDTENSQFTFTAGGIDGSITAHMAYNGEDVSGGLTPQAGDPGVELSLEDIKPGDFGSICFNLEVTSNPAWVASCVGVESDTDYETYEPEVDADSDVSASDIGSQLSTPGELAESLYIIPFYRGSCPSNFWDPDGLDDGIATHGVIPDSSDLQSINAVGTSEQFWNSREGTNDFGQLQPQTIGNVSQDPMALSTTYWHDGELNTVEAPEGTSVGDGCVFLDGEAANEDVSVDARDASPLQPGDTLSFGYDWHLPFAVGNEAQGDRLEFNLGFNFAQIRHTSAPELANIYSPGDNT